MELRRTETGFALYKEKEVIGHCTLHPAAQGAAPPVFLFVRLFVVLARFCFRFGVRPVDAALRG